SRQKHALQVYVVDPVPTLFASLDRAADFDDTGIVVQHVDPPECPDASIDYRSNVICAGHISSDRLADTSFRLDDSLAFERHIEIDIGGDDLCRGRRAPPSLQGKRFAYPRRASPQIQRLDVGRT